MSQAVADRVAQALHTLAGQPGPHVLVTGGPTCEDIDSVRFLTNRSTGRMGIALAAAAVQRRCSVLLVLGPTPLAPPDGAACVRVRSAQEMCGAVLAGLPWCQALLMAAAVADYAPAHTLPAKRAKDDAEWVLRLRRTPDVLAAVRDHPDRTGKTVLGFALQDKLDVDAGTRKLRQKGLDAIVVNTTAAFGAGTSPACLIRPDGTQRRLDCASKSDLAAAILDEVGVA